MKVILNDGTELVAKRATQGSGYIQGAQRETLELVFDPEVIAIDAVDAAMTAAGCERIKICGDGCEYVYHEYVVRVSLQKLPTDDGGMVCVTMARRTGLEAQVTTLAAGQTALQDAVDVLALEALGIPELPEEPPADPEEPPTEQETAKEGGEEADGNV